MGRGIHRCSGNDGSFLPPLAGRSFLAPFTGTTDDYYDFVIAVRRGDDVESHAILNLPPEWSLPDDPDRDSDDEADVWIDTRSGTVWFRPSADGGTSVAELARVIAAEPGIRTADELNHCPASVLSAMVAALVVYAETEADVRLWIDGERLRAQMWAAFAVITYNWHRRTA